MTRLRGVDPEFKAGDAATAGPRGASGAQVAFEPLGPRALPGLLALQCRIGRARAGAVLIVGEQEDTRVLASHPIEDASGADWIRLVGPCLPELSPVGQARTRPLQRSGNGLYGSGPEAHLVVMDAGRDAGGGRRVEAFVVEAADVRELNHCRELLELSRTLLDLRSAQATASRAVERSRRLGQVIGDLEAFQREPRFRGAAMALCNELCIRLGAERVSLGFLGGRYVKLAAMSQTEHVNRKMQLVQDVEAAMEECLDQDVEVIHPAGPELPVVSRSAAELGRKHGPSTVLTMPLRDRAGDAVAAVTVERDAAQPFDEQQVRMLRLLCNLVTPRLLELHASDRWFGARWATLARTHAATALGPEHTSAKVAAIVLVATAAFLIFARGTDYVEGTFVVEPVIARSVPAPWDGFLEDVTVEPGDMVQAGQTVLGQLDTAELRMQLAQSRADHARAMTEADLAWREDRQAERLIAQARARQAQAQIDLLEHRLSQASILAPLTGVVTQGDLRKELGRPVEKGQVLFEVAPLDALRAVMMVPEDRIFAVREGQVGELATASHPGDKLPFVVEHIYPVAEVVDQQNVFRVRLRLEPTGEANAVAAGWLKPNVEGVAKADAGQAPYAWLWTRDAINWVRMKLWR